MGKNVGILQKSIPFVEGDVSRSLKGLLMDKGRGHLEEAVRDAALNVETAEAMMVKLSEDYNELNAPYIKLYVRREKRIKSGAKNRIFLMWTARGDLAKAMNQKIRISALVDPLEIHKDMGSEVMKLLKANPAHYQRVTAYDFIRHKMNAIYALHYDQYKTICQLRDTVNLFHSASIDADTKRQAREINQEYIEIPGLESLFAV